MAVATEKRRISRKDLESAFAKAFGEGEEAARSAVPQIAVVAGAVALAALTVAYLAGRRRGRRRTARIEIKQV